MECLKIKVINSKRKTYLAWLCMMNANFTEDENYDKHHSLFSIYF